MFTRMDIIKLTMKPENRLQDQDYLKFANNEIEVRLKDIFAERSIYNNQHLWSEALLLINDLGDKINTPVDQEKFTKVLRASAINSIIKIFTSITEMEKVYEYQEFKPIDRYCDSLKFMDQYEISWDEIGFDKKTLADKIEEIKVLEFDLELSLILKEDVVNMQNLALFIQKVKNKGVYSRYAFRLNKFKKTNGKYNGLYDLYLDQINNSGSRKSYSLLTTIESLKDASKTETQIHGNDINTMIKNLINEVFNRTQNDLHEHEQTDWHLYEFKSSYLCHSLKMYFTSRCFHKEHGFAGLTLFGEPVSYELLDGLLEIILHKTLNSGPKFELDLYRLVSDLSQECWWKSNMADVSVRFLSSLAKKVTELKDKRTTDTFICIISNLEGDLSSAGLNLEMINLTKDDIQSYLNKEKSFKQTFEYLLKQDGLNQELMENFLLKQQVFLNKSPEVSNTKTLFSKFKQMLA